MIKLLNKYTIFIFSLVLCEKFCFYSIRYMVILYITNYLLLSETEAFRIVFSMMALSYITAVLGGMIGDYILGYYKSCVLGVLFFLVGDISLLLPSNVNFYFGLACISLSEGILRTNITSLLVEYTKSKNFDKTVTDSIFTMYYSFINLGIALGILFGSVLGEIFKWNLTFIFSGIIGICASYILYLGRNQLNLNFISHKQNFSYINSMRPTKFYILVCIIPFLVFYVMLSSAVLQVSLILLIILSLYMVFKNVDKAPYRKYFELIWSFLILIPFFAFYEQGTSSVILLINNFKENGQNIDFKDIPTTIFQSIDPILSMMLGFLISHFWAKKKFILSKLKRIILSFAMLSAAFCILKFIASDNKIIISYQHILVIYVFFVFAEVIITPLGLSIISSSTFVKRIGTVIGLYNTFIAAGQWSAGIIAILLFYDKKDFSVYHNGYYFLMNIALGISLFLIFCLFIKNKFIKN